MTVSATGVESGRGGVAAKKAYAGIGSGLKAKDLNEMNGIAIPSGSTNMTKARIFQYHWAEGSGWRKRYL